MKSWCLYYLFIAALLPTTGLGQNYQHKLDLFENSVPRFLGEIEVGNISQHGLRLYVDDARSHHQLFGFEINRYDNDVDPAVGLILLENEFNFGLNYPATSYCDLRIASSYQSFMGDEPFFSYGLYPSYQREQAGLELGHEADPDGNFSYLLGNLRYNQHQVFYAWSRENFSQHGSVEEHHNRFGGGLRYGIKNWGHLLGAVNYNFHNDEPSWVMGFSHDIKMTGDFWNPGLMAVHRIKPGSHYTLCIFTLGGRALNEQVNYVLHEAFVRGAWKRSRIIGGRYMGTVGISSAYEQQDFGIISLAYSGLSIKASNQAELTQYDLTGYCTYPGHFGPLVRPYLGLTWADFSDLVFDPATHSLQAPNQNYWEFKVGGKIRLSEHPGPPHRAQLGYLRVNLALDNRGGVRFKTSFWF